MKYKRIPSALHNFGHSFVSLMNYWEGEYIVDILEQIARTSPDYEVKISFSESASVPSNALQNLKLAGSMEHWRARLPGLLTSHDVDPKTVQNIMLRFRLTRKGKEVIVEALDDCGKQHKVFVHGML